jgi:hypothetical protein
MTNADKLFKDFRRFHAKNPHVYRLFVRFSLQATGRRPYFSARTVLHRIRWETTIETDDPKGFKVANAWSAFYARMFERDLPEHKGFFRMNDSVADAYVLPA